VRVAAPARANYELFLTRSLQRAQLVRNSIQTANALSRARLLTFQQVPVLPDFRHVCHSLIAEDVRMPPNHFVGQRVDHIGDGELAALGRQLRVEDNLQ